MPELPEVETIARLLSPHLRNRTITGITILWEGTLDRPAPRDFENALTGAQIKEVSRRGKFLLFATDQGKTLLVHLRMTGKFFLRSAKEGPGDDPHTRVRFELDHTDWLLFSDTRKLGRFYLVDAPEELLAHLGPEPLSPTFTAEAFTARLARHRGEIKRLLMDQTFIAGVGNIYASEALWRAGIHPQRSANSLSSEEAHQLHRAIVTLLQESIRHGGTSLDDRQYVYPNGDLGQQQKRLAVYDREGECCPHCGYAVQRIVQGQRSTYFCPVCQRLEATP